MDSVKFYRYFALVPLLAPALAWLVAWAFPELQQYPLGRLGGVIYFIKLTVVGVAIYLPFAALIDWLLRHRPVQSYRTSSYWVPLTFALWVFAVWFLFLGSHDPLTERA